MALEFGMYLSTTKIVQMMTLNILQQDQIWENAKT